MVQYNEIKADNLSDFKAYFEVLFRSSTKVTFMCCNRYYCVVSDKIPGFYTLTELQINRDGDVVFENLVAHLSELDEVVLYVTGVLKQNKVVE